MLPIPTVLRPISNRQTIIINYVNNKPIIEIYKEWVRQCLDAIKDHHIINIIGNSQMDPFKLNIAHIHNQTDITSIPYDSIEYYTDYSEVHFMALTDADFIRPYLIPLMIHYLNQTKYKDEFNYQITLPTSPKELLNELDDSSLKTQIYNDIIGNTDLFQFIEQQYRLNKKEALNQIFLHEVTT